MLLVLAIQAASVLPLLPVFSLTEYDAHTTTIPIISVVNRNPVKGVRMTIGRGNPQWYSIF
jgi:hypothetical protein